MTERLRVAFVVESWATGVLAVIALLANSLPVEDFDITIIHGRRPETPPDARALFRRPVTLVPWRVQREVAPLDDLRALRELMRHLRAANPDVIHGQSSKGGALARIAAFLMRRPVLYSPHGFGFLVGDSAPRKAFLYRMLEYFLGRLPGLLIASSQGESEAARQVARRVILLPNMMDVSGLMPVATAPSGRTRVGAMGRIGPQKNFPLFAEVARLCRPVADFVWIGGGEDVSGLARQAGIHLTGLVPRAQALAELATLDLVIQTSRWEGLSVALMEAMALAKPVLATNAVGNADLVHAGENGFLCDRAEEFADRIGFLAGDGALRARFGAASRAIMESRFSVEALLPRWVALYRQAARQ